MVVLTFSFIEHIWCLWRDNLWPAQLSFRNSINHIQMSSKSIVTGFIPGEDLMETNCNDKYKYKRKKRAWAVDTYIDFNNYCCKDTNTKYKKEEGGVGSWCQEAQHNNIALIQVRNTDTRWETLIQGEAHWYKVELWYKEVRSYKKVHWYIVHQWYKDTKI